MRSCVQSSEEWSRRLAGTGRDWDRAVVVCRLEELYTLVDRVSIETVCDHHRVTGCVERYARGYGGVRVHCSVTVYWQGLAGTGTGQ